MSKKLLGGSEVSEKKSNAGRKTKYNEEMQKKADDYINNYSEYETLPDGKVVVNTIPTSTELAYKLRVHRETIYNWGKENRQFFDTLERIKQKQEMMITKHGLTRNYDSSFAKFIAVNVTSYKDKVEQTVNQKTIQINIDKEDSEL